MPQEIYDKYTRSLYNIINIDLINIWENVTFNLPEIVNLNQLKTLFEQTYMYREIGVETIAKWLDLLKYKVYDLSIKYTPLFTAYADEYDNDDIYVNNTGDYESEQKFYDTPQSQLVAGKDYLTTQTNNSGSEKRLTNMTKAEAREIYANKLRFLYHEFVKECKNLFMGVF